MNQPSNAYTGFATLFDAGGEYNRTSFLIRMAMANAATMTLVLVKAVHAVGRSYTVDVQPMVHQVDGAGNATSHGTIFAMPVWRLQGGTAAIVVVPAVGDIGLAVFAHSDISGVKRAKKPTTPGSARRLDWSDGVYLGGVLNADPAQSIVMDGANITINAVGALTINAPSGATIAGDLQVNGKITATGEGTFNGGHTVSAHKHGGVTTGSGTSGTPSG